MRSYREASVTCNLGADAAGLVNKKLNNRSYIATVLRCFTLQSEGTATMFLGMYDESRTKGNRLHIEKVTTAGAFLLLRRCSSPKYTIGDTDYTGSENRQ